MQLNKLRRLIDALLPRTGYPRRREAAACFVKCLLNNEK